VEPVEEYVEDAIQDWQDTESSIRYTGPPIPVVNLSRREAPEFGSTMTWSVPQSGIGQPVQILTRRIRRYKAKILVAALGGATSVMFNSNLDRLSLGVMQGFTVIIVGLIPDWESQQPLYAVAIGGGPATISVIDESYAEVTDDYA
jgi:hypothetical protein